MLPVDHRVQILSSRQMIVCRIDSVQSLVRMESTSTRMDHAHHTVPLHEKYPWMEYLVAYIHVTRASIYTKVMCARISVNIHI